jgi:hypothetical protein
VEKKEGKKKVGRPKCLPPCESNNSPQKSTKSKRKKRLKEEKTKIGKARKKERKK